MDENTMNDTQTPANDGGSDMGNMDEVKKPEGEGMEGEMPAEGGMGEATEEETPSEEAPVA